MQVQITMKVVSVLIICLLLISVVRGEEDVTCKAGEGRGYPDIRTSGSQCRGVSKITTEAECKLAAEYNRKNNIDKNDGYGGRSRQKGSPRFPFSPCGALNSTQLPLSKSFDGNFFATTLAFSTIYIES